MLRALFFAIKVGLFVAVAVWVARRPGTIEINWLDYKITAEIGVVLLIMLVALVFILFLHRLVLAIAGLPALFRRYLREMRQKKGYSALARGLSAVAAGDRESAGQNAAKARRYMPQDQGLIFLLEAQAARLRGHEDEARTTFRKMLDNKDTAFLGLRGLLVHALESGNQAEALEIARRGLQSYPRQPWLLEMAYGLEIRKKDWQAATRTLAKGARLNVFTPSRVRSDKGAMLVAQAMEQDGGKNAVALLKKAYKGDPAFIPAAELLADLYIKAGNHQAARRVICRTWAIDPHPDLVPLWMRMVPAPRKKDSPAKQALLWLDKLIDVNSFGDRAMLEAAQIAMDASMPNEARQYLAAAEKIMAGSRYYMLMAMLEEQNGDPEQAAHYRSLAADAPAGKVWTCRESGKIYERWMPFVPPHQSFNTMIWGYPHERTTLPVALAIPQTDLLSANSYQ